MYVRVCACVCEIDPEDKYLYIGTTTGDVVIVNIAMKKLCGTLPPVKKRFNMGVTAIEQFKSGEFVVGAGDGVVCLCYPLFNRTTFVFVYLNISLSLSLSLSLSGLTAIFFQVDLD